METPIYPIPGFSEPVSSIVHLVAAAVFAVASLSLVRRGRGDPVRTVGMGMFSFSCVLLLSLSGVYHLLTPGTAGREVLQRLDHAAIFSLIAATFTAAHAALFRGAWRWVMIVLIWFLAVLMITLQSIFFREMPEWLSLMFYLGMGWIGVVSGWKVWRTHGLTTIRPLLLGGAAYSLGAIFEFMRAPVIWPGVVGPHEVWHVAVIFGVSYHWVFLHRSAQMLPDVETVRAGAP